jgi:hypothetical protein
MGNHWEKSVEIYGISMGKVWEIFGTAMGNLWEIYGHLWEIYGHLWEIYGKSMKTGMRQEKNGDGDAAMVIMVVFGI